MANFTPEQIIDIQEREKQALDMLKKLQLTPAASLMKIKMGNDIFADKLIPFLNDTKYSEQPEAQPVQDCAVATPYIEPETSNEKTDESTETTA